MYIKDVSGCIRTVPIDYILADGEIMLTYDEVTVLATAALGG